MAKRRISVAQFRGEDAEIEFANGDVYPVRGDLPMEVVLYMSEIDDASQNDDEGSLDWVDRGRGLLTDLIQEKTPKAKLPMLSPQEILGTLASLVGGESVGQALSEAMTLGLAEAVEQSADELALDAEDGSPLEETAPTPTEQNGSRSAKGSSDGSSGSPSPTTGSRPGGAKSRGASSKSSASSTTKKQAA